MILFLTCTVLLIVVLISVGFFTLLERKFLGYMHIRSGPCNLGFLVFLSLLAMGWNYFFKIKFGLLILILLFIMFVLCMVWFNLCLFGFYFHSILIVLILTLGLFFSCVVRVLEFMV